MQKKRKYRYIILQKIRIRASIKQKRRQKPRKKKQKVEAVQIPSIPRKFRRNMVHTIKYKKISKSDLMQRFLPEDLLFMISQEGIFNLESIKEEKYHSKGIILLPQNFTVNNNYSESYVTLRKVISALFIERTRKVTLDYSQCTNIGLSTQVILDVILKNYVVFFNNSQVKRTFPKLVGGINVNDETVKKMTFSVGSAANFGSELDFPDITKYKLKKHDNRNEPDQIKRIEKKELDITDMINYVENSLKKINKQLTPAKREDLCTIIGEILINAEEHSTTKYFYSCGYCLEDIKSEKHSSIFRLVIMNFGKTIYEKFKSEDCPNKDIVERMSELSESYTKKLFFSKGAFEEECLWTLYALQEGITSIPKEQYKKRGNGSIRFIDSFFNIKGSKSVDNYSKLSIVSGSTRIVFDGEYSITEKTNGVGETFKVMTFNKSGNIEDKPDSKYVFFCKNYFFPGTIINAKILLNDDDIRQI